MPTLHRPFCPHPLLINGHVQTLAGAMLRRNVDVTFRRFSLPLSDGEVAIVDEAIDPRCTTLAADAPLVVILHGLSGSSDSSYVRHLIARFHGTRSGAYRVLVVHARGAARPRDNSNEHLLTMPKFYSAAFIDDLRDLTAHFQRLYPGAVRLLIGFSMGANIVANFLGQTRCDAYAGAMSISNPYSLVDLNEQRMNRYPGLFYSRVLVEGLKEFLTRNYKVLQQQQQSNFDIDHALESSTVHEFDQRVVVPMHKFESTRAYYVAASSNQHVAHISIPFLSVAAADDPLCLPSSAPDVDRCSDNAVFALSSHGGHVAHLTSFVDSALDALAVEFCDAVIQWRTTEVAADRANERR